MSGGIRITWTDTNPDEDGHRVYRSLTPIDPEALPMPLANLPAGVEIFKDTDVVAGETYFYRISAWRGEDEAVSAEVSCMAPDPENPGGSSV